MRRQPANKLATLRILLVFWLAATTTIVGCDDGVDDHVPAARAEVRATYLAETTVVEAREMILLHPQSDRQRHARQQLIYLESLEDRIAEDMGNTRQKAQPPDFEHRLQVLQRWTDLVDDSHLAVPSDADPPDADPSNPKESP